VFVEIATHHNEARNYGGAETLTQLVATAGISAKATVDRTAYFAATRFSDPAVMMDGLYLEGEELAISLSNSMKFTSVSFHAADDSSAFETMCVLT
jgi:hypothetical protein